MHEIDTREVILRPDLVGGVCRSDRLAVGDVLQRQAGRVTSLTLAGDVIRVQTDVGLWLITALGWVHVDPGVERRTLSDAEAALIAPGAMFATGQGPKLADVQRPAVALESLQTYSVSVVSPDGDYMRTLHVYGDNEKPAKKGKK